MFEKTESKTKKRPWMGRFSKKVLKLNISNMMMQRFPNFYCPMWNNEHFVFRISCLVVEVKRQLFIVKIVHLFVAAQWPRNKKYFLGFEASTLTRKRTPSTTLTKRLHSLRMYVWSTCLHQMYGWSSYLYKMYLTPSDFLKGRGLRKQLLMAKMETLPPISGHLNTNQFLLENSLEPLTYINVDKIGHSWPLLINFRLFNAVDKNYI